MPDVPSKKLMEEPDYSAAQVILVPDRLALEYGCDPGRKYWYTLVGLAGKGRSAEQAGKSYCEIVGGRSQLEGIGYMTNGGREIVEIEVVVDSLAEGMVLFEAQ